MFFVLCAVCNLTDTDKPMLNLYKLEIFVRVAEEGSFSAAAERLLMTQSGVSQHVQDLEAALGTQLFDRGYRGVQLTAAGVKLADYAKRIFALVAEAESAITNVANLASGQVRVGATPGMSIYVLPPWIQSFHSRYPQLMVTLQTKTTPEIVAALTEGSLDIGFIEGELDVESQPKLNVTPLQVIEQYVIVGKQHPFWSRTEVELRELDGQTLIMRQPHSQTRIWLDEELQRHGVRPHVGAEFDNVESIKRAVIASGVLTILPEYAVRDELGYGLLRLTPIAGHPLQRTLKLIWARRVLLSPVTRALLDHLRGCLPTIHY
jgi:DNA-binding transcriptional LysR family regulator